MLEEIRSMGAQAAVLLPSLLQRQAAHRFMAALEGAGAEVEIVQTCMELPQPVGLPLAYRLEAGAGAVQQVGPLVPLERQPVNMQVPVAAAEARIVRTQEVLAAMAALLAEAVGAVEEAHQEEAMAAKAAAGSVKYGHGKAVR